VNPTAGSRVNCGLLQTLVSTFAGCLPWIDALQPDIYVATGIPRPQADSAARMRWLLVAALRGFVPGPRAQEGQRGHHGERRARV